MSLINSPGDACLRWSDRAQQLPRLPTKTLPTFSINCGQTRAIQPAKSSCSTFQDSVNSVGRRQFHFSKESTGSTETSWQGKTAIPSLRSLYRLLEDSND